MLNIYVRDKMEDIPSDLIFASNIEVEFGKFILQGTNLDKILMKEIEQADYLDRISFIDRFGYKLYLESLSTGCKAALCTANMPNKLINYAECGRNVLNTVIHLCSEGNILVNETALIFEDYDNAINVKLDNIAFRTVKDLVNYIKEKR